MDHKNRISESQWFRNCNFQLFRKKILSTLFCKTRTDLSHHPVFRSDTETTKFRPVSDESYNEPYSPWLPEKGPKCNNKKKLPALLLIFHEKWSHIWKKIERGLKKESRNYLKFPWWKKKYINKIYSHARVEFGITLYPCLLAAVTFISFIQYAVRTNICYAKT